MQTMKVELDRKINEVEHGLSARMDRLEMKFKFMILFLIITLTLMNFLAAEVIESLFAK